MAAGLPVWQAIAAQTGGTLTALLPYLVMATVGVDRGIPGRVATRMAFGRRGTKLLPSMPRTIASIYRFAFQAVFGPLAIAACSTAEPARSTRCC